MRAGVLACALLLTACASTPEATVPSPAVSPAGIAALTVRALASTPPGEPGPFRPDELVEVATLDPTLRLDVRYATADNFLGVPVYTQARVFLQRPAAEALLRAHVALREQGYGLWLFDGYRPWYVTKVFWDATPPDKRAFVADPARGSRHNRGCAIDLSLYDLRTGRPVSMPSGYDEFSERAHPDYAGGTVEQRARRDLLRRAMEAQGFTVNDDEWWHYDHRDWQSYRIGTARFEDLGK